MKNFLKRVALLILLSLIIPTTVHGHAGGGLPFLKVNNEYALTHQLIAGYPDSKLNIPQDYVKDSFVTGTPIQFKIEKQNLGLMPELQSKARFVWNWDDGTQKSYGEEITHTFAKSRSYIISVDIEFPEEKSQVLLDTVLIHSVPSKEYIIPQPSIKTKEQQIILNKPVNFSFDVKKDKDSYIKSSIWKLDFGEYSQEENPTFTYKNDNSTHMVFLKVTDSNDFVGFSGITINAYNGVVEIKNVLNPAEEQQSDNLIYILLATLLVVFAIAFFSYNLFKYLKNRK